MDKRTFRRLARAGVILLGIWLGVRYLLPVSLPFLLGTALAVSVEPLVGFLHSRLRLPRAAGAALAVTGAFVMLLVFVWLLLALLYRELAVLASGMSTFFAGVGDLADRVRSGCLNLAARAPEGLDTGLTGAVTALFNSGDLLLEKAAGRAISMVSGVMGWIPGSALLLGTTVISSFMISAKLPKLKLRLEERLPRLREGIDRVRSTLGSWLKAQLKLSGMTFAIVAAGLLLLRTRGWLLWALLVALVDAVPILGTGTVLLPWCLISLARGESVRAIGLLGLYVTAMMTRSALEPRLVGRQLGIDPLLTLAALYAGYCFWGVGGMLLAPIVAVSVKEFLAAGE